MSAIELLYGQRSGDTVGLNATTLDLSSRGEVSLPAVEIHYCLFELPMAHMLPRLPESLHPSIPAILGITVWRCSAGPLGPFSLAWIGLACRTGIKPRHFIHSAFCDNEEVGRWFKSRYGFPCQTALVHSLETYDRIHSRVELEGTPILDLETHRLQPLVGLGAMVKYSPPLNPARLENGVALVQMEATFEFMRVARGVPHAPTYAAAALGDDSLRPVYAVSGTFAVANIGLHPPRFSLSPRLPAEQGGAKKI